MCARNKLFHNNKAHLPPDTENSFLHSRVYRVGLIYIVLKRLLLLLVFRQKLLIQIFKPFTEERIRASTVWDLLHCNPWLVGCWFPVYLLVHYERIYWWTRSTSSTGKIFCANMVHVSRSVINSSRDRIEHILYQSVYDRQLFLFWSINQFIFNFFDRSSNIDLIVERLCLVLSVYYDLIYIKISPNLAKLLCHL